MKPILLFFTLMLCLWSCESKKTCPFCQGSGAHPQFGTCPVCQGEQELTSEKYDRVMQMFQNLPQPSQPAGGHLPQQQVACPLCAGSGIFSGYGQSSRCGACNGTGMVSAAEAQQYIQGMQQIDAMLGIDGNNGYNPGTSSGGSEGVTCRLCRGTGACNHCKGTGLLEYEGMYGMLGSIDKCAICKGSGHCNVCHGRGVIR